MAGKNPHRTLQTISMALVIFRSRAAGEILMLSDSAQRLLACIGKPMAERGVIASAQIDQALAQLQEAVDAEKSAGGDSEAPGDPPAARPVSFGQRAYPLMQMLRAARKRGVDVTWGI